MKARLACCNQPALSGSILSSGGGLCGMQPSVSCISMAWFLPLAGMVLLRIYWTQVLCLPSIAVCGVALQGFVQCAWNAEN